MKKKYIYIFLQIYQQKTEAYNYVMILHYLQRI